MAFAMKKLATNGPTYPLIASGIEGIQCLSAVEWFKLAAVKASGATKPEEQRRVSNWAIDSFIASKWAMLLAAWWLGWRGRLIAGAIIYLLAANAFTYFWYHLWVAATPTHAGDNPHRDRRRFLNLLSAMAFSMACYAYLYHRVFASAFDWPRDIPPALAALTFSVGNALTGAVGDLRVKTGLGYVLMSSQLVMTFVFVAMLLSTSIPGQRSGQEE